jgi:hypothetical protein
MSTARSTSSGRSSTCSSPRAETPRPPVGSSSGHQRDQGHARRGRHRSGAGLPAVRPAAWHRTDQYANNRVECDHGRLKARLRAMRAAQLGRRHQSDRGRACIHAEPFGVAITNWRSRSQRTGEQPSRSTNWPWRSDREPTWSVQRRLGRRNATAPHEPPWLGLGGDSAVPLTRPPEIGLDHQPGSGHPQQTSTVHSLGSKSLFLSQPDD